MFWIHSASLCTNLVNWYLTLYTYNKQSTERHEEICSCLVQYRNNVYHSQALIICSCLDIKIIYLRIYMQRICSITFTVRTFNSGTSSTRLQYIRGIHVEKQTCHNVDLLVTCHLWGICTQPINIKLFWISFIINVKHTNMCNLKWQP